MPLSLEELQSIADGDTVRTQQGTAVRLTGFNAPEVAHENTGVAAEPGAAMSTQLTQEYLQQPGSSADVIGQDVYGRTLGRASAPGLGSLAEEQLKRGLGSPMATEGRISDAERRAYLIGQRERRSPSTPEQARINQQLDREWQGATTNAPNVRQKFKRDIGDTFSDAIDRGLSQMGMMTGGTQRLLGEMTGIDSLVKAGDKRIEENKREVLFNPADIGTMDKVNNVGDGFTYVLEKLGEQGPNLLATIGTAAATGGAGAALRLGATKLASEKLAVQAAASAMGTIGKGMTLTTGAALGAGTLNIGESKLHLDEIAPDGDHNLLALSTGLMKTGLDVMSLRQLARPLMGLARQRGMNPGKALKAWDIPAEVGRAALIEGGTEALQGLLDEAAGKAKYGVDINWQNVKESGAVGFISGGGFAVPINVASVGLQKALQPGEARPEPAGPNASQPQGADPAAARAEYEAALQRVQDLQQQAEGLAPGSPERTAAEEEMDALAARGLELQQTLQNAQSPAAPRFSGPLNYTDWQALSDEDKQRYVNEVGMPPPPGGTTAEPASDIAAQLAALDDPTNPKNAMWIAGGTMQQANELRARGKHFAVLRDSDESGLFVANDAETVAKAQDAFEAGVSISRINEKLLYPGIPADTKARAAADPNAVVVQEQDAEGNVVAEAGASQADAPAVAEALAEQRVEGGQQVLTDPVSVQERRISPEQGVTPLLNPLTDRRAPDAAPVTGERIDAFGNAVTTLGADPFVTTTVYSGEETAANESAATQTEDTNAPPVLSPRQQQQDRRRPVVTRIAPKPVHPLDEMQGRIDLAATPEERAALEAEADQIPAAAVPNAATLPNNIHAPKARFPETDRLWGRVANIPWFLQHLEGRLKRPGKSVRGNKTLLPEGRAVITEFVGHLKNKVIEEYNRKHGADPTPYALNLLLREKVEGGWTDRQLVDEFFARYRTNSPGAWSGVQRVTADVDEAGSAPIADDGGALSGDPLEEARYAANTANETYAGNDESTPYEAGLAQSESIPLDQAARAAEAATARESLGKEEADQLQELDRLAREGGFTSTEQADILGGTAPESRAGKRALGAAAPDTAALDTVAQDPEADQIEQAGQQSLDRTMFDGIEAVDDLIADVDGATADGAVVFDALRKRVKNKFLRILFTALAAHTKGITIRREAVGADGQLQSLAEADPEGTSTGVRGYYDPEARQIVIRTGLPKGIAIHTMVHEAVHAATLGALQNNAIFARRISELLTAARRAAKARGITAHEIEYGLKDEKEFLAQLYSSPQFVAFLDSVGLSNRTSRTDAKDRSIFRRAIDEIRKFLRLEGRNTVAADAIEVSLEQIIRPPQASVTGERVYSMASTARNTANAIRNAEPVQRVLNAPQGARLRTLGTELATGTGRAKHFLSRAVQAFLTSDHQLRQILTDSLENEQLANQIVDRIYVRPGTTGTVGFMQRAENERDTRLAAVESLLHKLENEVVDGRKRGRDGAHAVIAEAWAETEWANAALAENLRLAAELERRGEALPEGRPAPPMLGPVAAELQKIFGQVATYIESAGVRGFSRAYGRNGYYLPQIHDKGEVKARFNEFVSALIGLEYVNPVTGQPGIFNDASAREYANALIAEHESNSLADLPWSGSLKHRTLTDPAAAARLRDAGFMESSVSNIINYYVDAVTKATEFEREFGGYAKTVKRVRSSDPRAQPSFEETDQFETGHRLIRGTLHGLYGMPYSSEVNSPRYRQTLERAMRDGVIEATSAPNLFRVWQRDMQYQRDVLGKIKSKQGQLRFKAVFAGMEGNLGADMNPQWRRTQQWILAMQSITTLGFSTLSSLPELGVLAAGAPDWAAFRDGMKAVVVDRKSAWELLRDMGLAGEHISHIAMADNGVMRAGELPRVIMDKFFKLNGQHYWTQFLRAVALQMFKSTAQRFSESGTNAEFFAHYGVSREDVTQWLADDTPAFTLAVDSTGQSDPTSQFTVHPVAAAMRRFVNEHIAMPNRANVPLFFNDPRFALVVQLKRFFYAYGSQVLMRMARQAKTTYQKSVDRGDTRAAAAVLAAYPYLILGAFSLPLAAASRELKEYLKYDAWGEEAPKYATEGLAYWMDITRRTGALGPADLAVSMFDERSGGMVSLMGPLAAHLDVGLEHGFFSKEFLRRSTPILGQLNGVWK